jgi:hypothetical protein
LAAAPVMMKRPAGLRRAPWRAGQLADYAGWQGNDHRQADRARLLRRVGRGYAAVEALVNERIESLDGSVRVKRANAGGIEAELGKAEMACRMSTGEKLDTAMPLVTGESSIKGTALLERFVRLRRIRGAQACRPRLRCNAAHLAAP